MCSSNTHNRCPCFRWGRYRNGNHMCSCLWKSCFLSWHFLRENYHWWGLQHAPCETGHWVFWCICSSNLRGNRWVCGWTGRYCWKPVMRIVSWESSEELHRMEIWASIHMPGYWSKSSCVCFHIPSLTYALVPGKLTDLSVRKKSQDHKSWKKGIS